MDLKNVAVHCPTEELAKKVLAKADRMGYKWRGGDSFLALTNWMYHKEDTCYYIKEGYCCSLDWYKDNGFKIIPAEEFLNEGKAIKNDWFNTEDFYQEKIEILKKEKAILSLQIAVKCDAMDFSDYEYIKNCIEKYKEEVE